MSKKIEETIVIRNENWLLTHTEDYNKKVGHAITEEEAKSLLMRYAPDIYETEFEEIPEA